MKTYRNAIKLGMIVFSIFFLCFAAYHTMDILNASDTKSYGKITGRIQDMAKFDKIKTGFDNGAKKLDLQLYTKEAAYGDNIWFAMTTEAISPLISVLPYSVSTWDGNTAYYSTSNIKPYVTSLNNSLSSYPKDVSLIYERTVPSFPYGASQNPDSSETKFFTLFGWEYITKLMSNNVSVQDLHAGFDYWMGNTTTWPRFQGISDRFLGEWSDTIGFNPSTTQAYVRPAVYYNLDDLVFAVSDAYDTSTPSSYYKVDNTRIEPMKMRVENKTTPMQIQLAGIQNGSTSIQSITENQSFDVAYSGIVGGNANTSISLLVRDATTDAFIAYKPIDTYAMNAGVVNDVSVPGLPVGEYHFQLVIEEITADSSPTYSSPLSNAITIRVVPKLHTLTITPKQNLTYLENVDFEDVVATSNCIDGSGFHTYELLPSDDPLHKNDYQDFKIVSSDAHNASIHIANPNGLDAKTYKFQVKVIDDEDRATILTQTVNLTVDKVTPTVAFQNSNKTIKASTSAQSPWYELATSNPVDAGLHITYEISGGDKSIITLDKDSGEVQASSSDEKGTVLIKASVDDDPASGKDNFTANYAIKEIEIIGDVEGVFTPDHASTSTSTPTFKATDSNIKIGGTIGTLQGINGFFDDGAAGAITYTYSLKNEGDYSYFKVDHTTGVLQVTTNLPVGSFSINLMVSDKWSSKEIPVTIHVGQASAEELKFYDANHSNTAITSQQAVLGEENSKVFAEVKGSSNGNAVTYAIKAGSPSDIVRVHPTTGGITTLNAGTTIITATKKGVTGQVDATAELTFLVTTAQQTFIFSDVQGRELAKNADGTYLPYTENDKEIAYSKAGSFQLYTSNAPAGAKVTYALKTGSPTDVISVDASGLVTILNANLSLQRNKAVVVATSIDPSGNYADKSIELPINIIKTTPTISFKEVTNVRNGTGSVDPIINDMDISGHAGGVTVNDTQYLISVDSNFDSSIAWSNNGRTIEYSYSESTGIEVPLKVTKPGNRNYNSAEADGSLYIVGQAENILQISTPGKITYGDTFTIRSLQDDSSSSDVQYVFTINTATYIKEKTQNGNEMSFDAVKASGTDEIEITVERTANGEIPLSKTIKVRVLPKDINIQLDDKTKIVGEKFTPFTYQDFSSSLVSWNGVKDVFASSDIKISTTALQSSPSGTYPIQLDIDHLRKTYPNYNVKAGHATLTIEDKAIEDGWYRLEQEDTTAYLANTWVNQDVLLKSNHVEFTKFSIDKRQWDAALTIRDEGITSFVFYMQNEQEAIAGSRTETIQIDKTAPKITSIQGKASVRSKTEKFINALTFNAFYKPGVQIEIVAEDKNADTTIDYSGISEISYKLYEKGNPKVVEEDSKSSSGTITLQIENPGMYQVCAIAKDKAGNLSAESCEDIEVKKIDIDVDGDGENDFLDPDGDGCADLNIVWRNENDTWTKVNVDRNNDDIPDMNIDSDGDGKVDLNVDTDEDGNPDLNLVILTKADWKPTICVTTQPEEYCTGTTVKPKINVDVADKTGKFDDIPDINIDTNGDMKANINITKPNETKPFLNITSIHSTWKPERNFPYETFPYDSDDTMKGLLNVDSDDDGKPDLNIDYNDDGKPDLNIDANGDGLPETDIDGDGDGIRDMNIDTDEDGTPDENIIEIKTWNPDTDGTIEGFLFDTMIKIDGKNVLEDNDVAVEKPGGVFLPNFALKVQRITDTANELIKKDIINKSVGQVIVEIYDVKLLEDDVQIQPDGKLRIRLPLPKGIINPRLVIQQADGTYFKVKPEIKDGYLYYESDYLGLVSIVGDHEAVILPEDDLRTPDSGGAYESEPSVKGMYTTTGTNTGDDTNIIFLSCMLWIGGSIIITIRKRLHKN